LPPEFAALRPEALARVSVANARALASYRPAPYPGPTLLLQARDRREGRPPPEQGWAPLIPNLRVEDVEGDHHSIVRPPHVEALARALDRWLGRYEPSPPRPAG
jgi:thioesterase domain-containing protein